MYTSGRYQILTGIGIFSLADQQYPNRSGFGGRGSDDQNAMFISTHYFIVNHPLTPDPHMNPVYEQSTANSNFGPYRNNIRQPNIDIDLVREIAADVKRKETIRGRSIKYKSGEKRHSKRTSWNNLHDYSYQNIVSSTSSRSVQPPSINRDRSNRNIYVDENVSDYDNDNTNKTYDTHDGIRAYASNELSQEHPEPTAESDVLDDQQDLEYDDDSMTPDEQKELFELLKDEVDLTPEQSYILGYFYESGIAIDKDYKQAINHYKYASDNGDISAMCNLGYLYESGYNDQGVKSNPDYLSAFKLYDKAAQQGCAQAQYNLATFYERGLGTGTNIPAAISLYKSASYQDHHEAQANLAYLQYNRGRYEKAYKYYLKAAKGGVPRAIFALGYLFQFGKGVKKNCQLAQSYYQEALSKGYLLAQKNLEILEKSETDTESLTMNIGDDNNYDEYFNFGDACLGGINREQDIGAAYSYYDFEMKNSHGKGSIERGLGMYYQYCGLGSEGFQRAFNLYLLSIELGHTASRYFLGVLLLQKQFFRAARITFEALLKQKPQNRNASYLFVNNEDEFMNRKSPVPLFTKITEQELFVKASYKYQQSLALELYEEKQYSKFVKR